MTELFNQVRQFVKEYSKQDEAKERIKHLERMVYWMRRLKPEADEALLIAGLTHDIGSASPRWRQIRKNFPQRDFTDKKFLKIHQEEGAKIIGEFLQKQKANPKIIQRVKELVAQHEEGGNEDQNLLKDADSLSFLENNIEVFLDIAGRVGKEKIKRKFNWMYHRITSQKPNK